MMLIMPYLAFRFKDVRSYLYAIAQLLTTIAAILLWVIPLSAKGALLFGVIILPSTGAGYAVLMGFSLANTAGYTKRTISSSGLYIGYCLGESRRSGPPWLFLVPNRSYAGNFVGPLCFKPNDAPRYEKGFLVVVVTSIVAGILALVYRWYCVWLNKTRDHTGIMEGFEHAYEDDLTDMKVRINWLRRSNNANELSVESTIQVYLIKHESLVIGFAVDMKMEAGSITYFAMPVLRYTSQRHG